jgi:hypothetical protein
MIFDQWNVAQIVSHGFFGSETAVFERRISESTAKPSNFLS